MLSHELACMRPARLVRTCITLDKPEMRILHNRLRQTAERPRIFLRASSSTAEGQNSEEEVLENSVEPLEDISSEDPAANDEWPKIPEVSLIDPNITLPAELLDDEEVLTRLYAIVHPHGERHYHAFFSSEFGGITTQPALMMVHMDDHMVHRGHAVFDTALIIEGNLYLLDQHLERFQRSAQKAELSLPCSVPQMKRIILETVACSMKMDGMVRFWLGGGRGGFGISPKECLRTSFYCLMQSLPEGSPVRNPGSDYLRGRRVKFSPIPIKDPFFATLKSNNYLPNVLTVIDAEKEGIDYGIFVDNDGFIAEGPTMNVAILTKQGELVIPPFENTLEGITVSRLMKLIEENMDSIKADTKGRLTSVVQRKFGKWEVLDCQEAMLIGSTTYVTSIVQWDGKDLGEGASGGEPGIVSLVLRALLKNDLDPTIAPKENFTEVPYGILTNMED